MAIIFFLQLSFLIDKIIINRVGSKMIKRVLKPWLWSDFVYYNLSADGREDRVDLKTLHNFTMKVNCICFYKLYNCTILFDTNRIFYSFLCFRIGN